ncbi:g7688 [Coccomyxa viridis]|uniref:G7688 protein n=1 Tax=Coccomyxa viridis TaxID=1274662 RepID=A0ABP1G537_9CHLO
MAGGVPVACAPTINSVDYQAGLYTIHGSLHIDLSEEAVLDVLTDYDGLSRIYNNIEDSQVLVNGSQKQVLQTCRWEFLVFSGTFETRLTVHEARQHGEVVFNLISSSFMRQFQGAWKVTSLAGGGCRVQHRLSVQPSLAPPEALASYTKKIFVRQVERLLEDLSRELCRVRAQR